MGCNWVSNFIQLSSIFIQEKENEREILSWGCYPHGGPSSSYNCVFLVPQSLPSTLAFVLTRLKSSVLDKWLLMVLKRAKIRSCTDGVHKRQHFLTEYVISSSRRPVLPKRKRMKEKFCLEECYPHGGPSYSYNCVFLVPQSLPPTLAFVLTRLKNSVLINFVEYMEEWNFKLKMLWRPFRNEFFFLENKTLFLWLSPQWGQKQIMESKVLGGPF